MRPEDHRSKAKSATRSRARMYLKVHLSFLPGYPSGRQGAAVRWTPVSADGFPGREAMTLEAENLRAARFGWNSLQRNFPRAVRDVVDEFDAWRAMLPALLDRLSEAIHRGAALRGSLFTAESGFPAAIVARAGRLRREFPRMAGVLEAASWVCALRRRGAVRLLAWLETHAAHVLGILENLPGEEAVRLVLRLGALAAAEGDRRVAPLLAALGGCPDCFRVATCGGEDYLDAWNRRLKHMMQYQADVDAPLPAAAPPLWANALTEFALWLCEQTAKVRRRALDYFNAAFPSDLLRRWRDWWAAADRESTPAGHLAARIAASTGKHAFRAHLAQLKRCAERIAALRATLPPAASVMDHPVWGGRGHVLDPIQSLALCDLEPLHSAIARLLPQREMEGGGILLRAAVLDKLRRWIVFHPAERLVPVLRLLMAHGLAGHVAGNVAPELDDAIDSFFDNTVPQRRRCKALAFWLLELKQTENADWPTALPQALADDAAVCEYLRSLAAYRKIPAGVYDDTIVCAARLAAGAADFPMLVEAVRRWRDKSRRDLSELECVWARLHAAGWGHLAAEAALELEIKRINQLAAAARLAQRLGGDARAPGLSPPTEIPTWADDYPAALHASIARVAALVPQPQRAVAGVLGEAFRDKASLGEELRYLDARLEAGPDDARLRRRRENLQKRMETPISVTAARLAHLDARLRRTVRRAYFDRWQAALRADTAPRLCRLLDTAEPPSWLPQARHQEALAGVLELRGWARQLGLRLLAMRCGPPPWSLADEPANLAWADRLTRMGVDMAPWLHPPAPQTRRGPNGREVRLCFESDPLEILQMGAYFRTCLSPGNANFFSTIANAADVNKHVIYARDDKGQVVGRCLVAVAENGGLLPFEAYCHDLELGFDKMIAALLAELAGRMKTVVVREGRVSSLVAGDWYDDGPIDLCGRFPCLEEGSPLRQALVEIDPAELIAQAEEAFRPTPLGALLVCRLIALPEFDRRPELVVPLLPRLDRQAGLSPSEATRVAELVHAAGRVEQARRITRELVAPRLGTLFWYSLQETYLTLARIDPSLMLRFIRRTRPRGVDQDLEENLLRLDILHKAHLALGRGDKAHDIHKRMEAIEQRQA